jgi:hypothetical protein
MLRRKILAVAVAVALWLPAISECFASSMQQAQAKQCCDTVTCAPSHQKQACFPAAPAPSHGWLAGPEMRTWIAAPAVEVNWYSAADEWRIVAWNSELFAETLRHPPPDLYTLHLSLLI